MSATSSSKGDTGRLRGRLDPIFARLKAMRPLRQTAIYRQLLIAEDLVGGEITAEWFQIESEPGAARLEITIARKPGSLLLGLDNYGGRDIGPLQATVRAQVNDVFGLFESTEITILANPANPARIAVLGFTQTVPLGTTGFSLGYGLANSWSNPGGAALEVGLHSEVTIGNVSLNYLLLREMERNVIVTAGAQRKQFQRFDVLGQPLPTRDRTRWVSVGVKYDDLIGGVGIVLNPVFLHGIDALRRERSCSGISRSRRSMLGATTNLHPDAVAATALLKGQYRIRQPLSGTRVRLLRRRGVRARLRSRRARQQRSRRRSQPSNSRNVIDHAGLSWLRSN